MWAYFGVGISRLVTWVLLRWKLGTFDFERYNHISPRIWTCMIFVQKWCNNLKLHPILNYPKILSTSMRYVSCFDIFVWILSQPAPANSRSVVATTVTSWAASWSWIGNMPRRLPGLSWPKGLLLWQGENEMHNESYITIITTWYLDISGLSDYHSGTRPLLHMLRAGAGQQRKHVLTADLAE